MMVKTSTKVYRCEPSHGRVGVTVIEILVSMTVLGTLIAVLLPAIQSIRASARRLECTSQLRQIGIANHNYHDAHQVLPPAEFGLFAILPYLEQESLYDDYMTTIHQGRINNSDWPNGDFKLYQCPSDGFIDRNHYRASYLYNTGTRLLEETNTVETVRLRNGMGGAVRFSDVVDGISQTAFYSERLTQLRNFSKTEKKATDPVRYSWWIPKANTIDEIASLCANSTARFMKDQRADHLGKGSIYPNSFYDHIASPNLPQCWAETSPQLLGTIPASSDHVGGVNLLFVGGRYSLSLHRFRSKFGEHLAQETVLRLRHPSNENPDAVQRWNTFVLLISLKNAFHS